MNLCSNCGVELEENLKQCPLCGNKQSDPADGKAETMNYPSDIIHLHKKETRKNIWELSGIIAFSGIAVCTIVDLVIGKGVKWSLFADVSIISAWLFLTFILLRFRKPWILITGLSSTLLFMLLMFDLISEKAHWFIPVGLPVALSAVLLVCLNVILYKFARFKGFNILAIIFLSVAGFCILLEIILDRFVKGHVNVRWSLLAAVSILPIALVLLFVHYRMKKGNKLDRYFHV
jgi:phosphatidylserine synthase